MRKLPFFTNFAFMPNPHVCKGRVNISIRSKNREICILFVTIEDFVGKIFQSEIGIYLDKHYPFPL